MLTSFHQSRGFLVPKRLIRQLQIEHGDQYEIEIQGENILFRKKPNEEKLKEKWIELYLKLFRDYDGIYYTKDNIVFIHLKCEDEDTWEPMDFYGVSKPYYKDKFDLDTGIAVATAHALGEAIPQYI